MGKFGTSEDHVYFNNAEVKILEKTDEVCLTCIDSAGGGGTYGVVRRTPTAVVLICENCGECKTVSPSHPKQELQSPVIPPTDPVQQKPVGLDKYAHLPPDLQALLRARLSDAVLSALTEAIEKLPKKVRKNKKKRATKKVTKKSSAGKT